MLSFCDKREAHPVTSFFPKFHRGLNRQKWSWGDLENYLSVGPKARVTEGCCCLTAPAWLMRDELSDVPYFRREGLCQGSIAAARVTAVRRAALIRFYIWARDNKTTI